MYKLYYSAGSCSTSCHITLEESGLPYEAIAIDFDETSDPNVALVEKLNPLGTLPILMTPEGKQLDQNVAIHTHIADTGKNKNILPQVGTIERAEVMNWLSFVTSDLHKSIGGIFSLAVISQDTNVQNIVREYLVKQSNQYLGYLNSKLEGKIFLTGSNFTVADAYAFVVLGWTKWVDISLKPYPNVEKFLGSVSARPSVQKVLKAEGLTE